MRALGRAWPSAGCTELHWLMPADGELWNGKAEEVELASSAEWGAVPLDEEVVRISAGESGLVGMRESMSARLWSFSLLHESTRGSEKRLRGRWLLPVSISPKCWTPVRVRKAKTVRSLVMIWGGVQQRAPAGHLTRQGMAAHSSSPQLDLGHPLDGSSSTLPCTCNTMLAHASRPDFAISLRCAGDDHPLLLAAAGNVLWDLPAGH